MEEKCWPSVVLTLASHSLLRMRRRARDDLSPFEVLVAAPPQNGMTAGGMALPPIILCEDAILTHCFCLVSARAAVRHQFGCNKAASLPEAGGPSPGEGPETADLEGE